MFPSTQRHWWTWQCALMAQSVAPVPAGWQLVPWEATLEMHAAADRAAAQGPMASQYKAMLSAAPVPYIAAPAPATKDVT